MILFVMAIHALFILDAFLFVVYYFVLDLLSSPADRNCVEYYTALKYLVSVHCLNIGLLVTFSTRDFSPNFPSPYVYMQLAWHARLVRYQPTDSTKVFLAQVFFSICIYATCMARLVSAILAYMQYKSFQPKFSFSICIYATCMARLVSVRYQPIGSTNVFSPSFPSSYVCMQFAWHARLVKCQPIGLANPVLVCWNTGKCLCYNNDDDMLFLIIVICMYNIANLKVQAKIFQKFKKFDSLKCFLPGRNGMHFTTFWQSSHRAYEE